MLLCLYDNESKNWSFILFDLDSSTSTSNRSKISFYGKDGTVWKSSKTFSRVPLNKFEQDSGVAPNCRNAKTPIETFSCFFTNEVLEIMVQSTNIYGKAYCGKRNKKWKNVTISEMQCFLGILIAAGRNKQNHLNFNEMWTHLKTWRVNFYRLAMAKDRFKIIYVCWRFDDFRTRSERVSASGDKLEPVRQLLDVFVELCQNNYIPPACLTIDERLCLFRGKTIYNCSKSFRSYF